MTVRDEGFHERVSVREEVPPAEFYEAYWPPVASDFDPRSRMAAGLMRVLRTQLSADVECLDIGCGNGSFYGQWVHGIVGGYAGVDISSAAVEQARRFGLESVTVGDAENLAFEPESFDVALAIEVLEHVLRPDVVVKEGFRVLRPGGRIVVTVPNVVYLKHRLDVAAGRFDPYGDALSVQKPWRDPHIRFFTAAALRRMLESAGFEAIEVSGYSDSSISSSILRRLGSRRTREPTLDWAARVRPSLFARRLSAVARRPGG